MKNKETEKLSKTLCIRISQQDYKVLNKVTNYEKRHLSKLIRNLIKSALNIANINNCIVNEYES